MISRRELRALARARLQDARALFRARRYDGAVYLCGYAVELALKARICQALRWPDFPSERREFEDLRSFQTHNLAVLLRLPGVGARISTRYVAEWSVVVDWRPELRYSPVGTASAADARDMIAAAQTLLQVL